MSQGTVKVYGRPIAVIVDCNPTGGTITWAGPGTFILPPACPVPPPGTVPADPGYVTIASGQTLVIDASGGPVTVESQGAGIKVAGGQLTTQGTDKDHTVTFVNDPTQVPAWNGLNFTIDPNDATKKGNGFLSYVSIQRAITAITIDSGATTNPSGTPFGLDVRNSGIEVSFFDGIKATNTPLSVLGDGSAKFGTINNIGSRGIDMLFTNAPLLTGPALTVDRVTFGSSIPFGQSTAFAGTIGNEAILASFAPTPGRPQAASVTNNTIFRAGNFGIHLVGTDQLTMQNNMVVCSGTGSATPVSSCTGTGLKYSAIDLETVKWDFNNGVSAPPVTPARASGNLGYNNGIDAIALSGSASQDVTWLTPVANTTDSSGKQLGYLINGSLDTAGHNLTVGTGTDPAIVKIKGGGISLSGGKLTATNATFTSLRDTVGIPTCPSVFAGGCPAPLPTSEWTGISLSGANSNGMITKSVIAYATKAVQINSGATSLTGGYGLVITDTKIGPTFSDGVQAQNTPVLISGDTFVCPTDTRLPPTDPRVCIGPSAGDHGINADFSGAPAHLGGGLKVNASVNGSTTFEGSINEAILGTGLAGQTVSITGTVIKNAGAYGMQLQGADNLTLKGNQVQASGTAAPRHSAIYLNGVSGDFGNGTTSAISGNTGTGNGLNAIVFHGTATTPTTWQTVGKSPPALGYLLDGSLEVDGNLNLTNDVAETLNGGITVRGGVLNSTDSTFTSLRDNVTGIPTCGTIFVPQLPQPSTACLAAAAGDWSGLSLAITGLNTLTGTPGGISEVRFATTGISIGDPTKPGTSLVLSMTKTNVRSVTLDGVNAQSAVISVAGGTFSNIGQHGIKAQPLGVVVAGQALNVDGASFTAVIGREAIFADSLGGQSVVIKNNQVDGAGMSGIYLQGADQLSLQNNTITNSGKATGGPFAAIYLNGVKGAFSGVVDLTKVQVAANSGAGNGLNALAFHGEAKGDLAWQTAVASTNLASPPLLGYILDDALTVDGSLILAPGDIVKVGKGAITLATGTVQADNTTANSQKVFTSLADNAAGIQTCPSVFLPATPCPGPQPGDWSGLVLNGSASGAFVNSAIRYVGTGITVNSTATSTSGSTVYGLVISRSIISSTKTDALNDTATPFSLTNSTLSGAGSRVVFDLTGAMPNAAIHISGSQFNGSGADAILGKALTNHPVWVTDNHIANALAFGIHLQNANALVVRNNNISSSGGTQYSAIYLDGVTANFAGNVRGNVGSSNYIDAIVFHGTLTSDLSWITPTKQPSTHPLGYLLDGALTIDGPKTMTVRAGDVVKSLGGPITLNGGTLKASDAGAKLFTSLKDSVGPAAGAFSCPSIFAPSCGGARGDWGGVVLSDDGAGHLGNGAFTDATLNDTVTGIAIDSGAAASAPSAGPLLTLSGTAISEASADAINAQDTPISIGRDAALNSSISGTGSRGIFVSFISSLACPATGDCLKLDHVHIGNTHKDAILATGLTGLKTEITDNCIGSTALTPCVPAAGTTSGAGTYGIRLVGADKLTLTDNHVFNSGNGAVHYPAVYLNGVTGDFTSAINGNTGSGNSLNAMVFHGTATTSMTWQTVGNSPPTLGYLLDGPLTVNGNLMAIGPPGVPHDVVETLNGAITVTGNLTARSATFTSLRDQVGGVTGCGSPFVPFTVGTTTCQAAAKGDWDGLKVGGTVTLDATTIKFAGNGALQVLGGPGVTLDCVSVHDNNGGIAFANGGSSVTNSDLFNNSSPGHYDLSNGGVTATTATPIWWGAAGGPVSGQISNPLLATTTPFLTTQDPTVTNFAVTDTNTNTVSHNFGKGIITVSLSFSRKMDIGTAPQVTFKHSGASVGLPLHAASAWSGDATSWTATYDLDPLVTPLPTAPNSVSVALVGVTSCIQDANNGVQVTPAALPFTVDYSLPTPSLTLAATDVGQTATLGVKINPQGWPTNGYFRVRASGNPYGTLPDAAISGIGSGNADKTLTVVYPPSGALTQGVTYFFQAVAQTGNGDVPASNELSFTANSKLVFTSSAVSTSAGTASSPITVQEQDNGGTPVNAGPSGVTVTLSSSSGTGTFLAADGVTALSPPKTVTIASGASSASFTYKDTTAGTPTLTAKATALADGTQVETITPGTVSASNSTVSAFPTTIIDDASQTSTITVTLKDGSGNAVSGKTASLTAGSGSSTITTISGTTDSQGRASFHVSDTAAETVTYTAHDTTDAIDVTPTVDVTFAASTVSPANSSVVAGSSSVLADGSTTTTITVTLKDGSSAAITGQMVSLSQNGASTIVPASDTTDGSGQVVFTVKDSTVETVTYAVIVNGVAVMQTSIDFHS